METWNNRMVRNRGLAAQGLLATEGPELIRSRTRSGCNIGLDAHPASHGPQPPKHLSPSCTSGRLSLPGDCLQS